MFETNNFCFFVFFSSSSSGDSIDGCFVICWVTYRWQVVGEDDGIQYGPFPVPKRGLPITVIPRKKRAMWWSLIKRILDDDKVEVYVSQTWVFIWLRKIFKLRMLCICYQEMVVCRETKTKKTQQEEMYVLWNLCGLNCGCLIFISPLLV